MQKEKEAEKMNKWKMGEFEEKVSEIGHTYS